MFHGILVIDKPAGRTSHDMVSWCRRQFGQKRVGHTGTLDPAATGVLPMCFGEATRLAEYFTGQNKTYAAEILLGYTSNTYDLEGTVQAAAPDFCIDTDRFQAALDQFRGTILQRAPLYSAISKGGKRLYQLARAGIEVEAPERQVVIHRLEISHLPQRLELGAKVQLLVVCSKGTYLRSLAHDLGQHLGCGALLSGLRRMNSGAFSLADARSPERIEEVVGLGESEVRCLFHPLTTRHLNLPWLEITPWEEREVSFGRAFTRPLLAPLGMDKPLENDMELLLLSAGELRAVARYQAGVLRPHKVFSHPITMEGVE